MLKSGNLSVLFVTNWAFTACFAVWTMFGVTGIPIRTQLNLDSTQVGLLAATPVLTGALFRLPLGIWTDRFGGRMIMLLMLVGCAVQLWISSYATALWEFLLLGLALGLVGAPFSVIGKGKDRPLGRLTKKSLRTRRELDRDLAMARRRGWALAREEAHLSLTAIGGAIRDSLGQPIAGISLSFLNQPYDQKRLTRLGMLVRATADTLSSRIVNYRSYGRSALEDVISSPMLEVNSN